jgi:hypothetical protein
MFDFHEYRRMLTAACNTYEQSAPTVCDHCDDLYRRMDEAPDAVTLAELIEVQSLWAEADRDGWTPPQYAANRVYKLRERLRMPTTGHAGF